MTAYGKRKQEREEARAKVRMILEAMDHPVKLSEIVAHPLAAGKISSIPANMYLRHMDDVVFDKKNKTWAIQKEKTKRRGPNKKKKNEREPTLLESARFIIKANGDLYLRIGGTSLPIEFE